MGDPKKLKKKYTGPRHPWVRKAIEEERVIKKDYGLGNKRELFKINSFLKKYKDLAKRLIANPTEQSKKEERQVLEKLQRLGLLPFGSKLDDVLSLVLTNVLDRRVQSIVFRKGLAKSMKQARQFITHRHITVNNQEITSPSYLVSLEEENQLAFKVNSSLASEDHPERANIAPKIAPETKKEAEKEVKEKVVKSKKEILPEEEVPEI